MKKLNIKAMLMPVAGSTLGIVASAKVDSIPFVAKQKPLIKGIGKVVIGALLPHFAKAKPGDLVSSAGAAMSGYGGAQIINSFVPGFGIAGVDMPTLGGMPTLGSVVFDEKYDSGGSDMRDDL